MQVELCPIFQRERERERESIDHGISKIGKVTAIIY